MRFLRSLRDQSVQPLLVVTQFGEAGVRTALDDSGLDFKLINSKSEMWSHTEVLNNAHLEDPQANLLWSTVDVIFGEHAFREINASLDSGSDYATIWPHLDVGKSENLFRWHAELDCVAIAGRISERVVLKLLRNRNEGWGLFENQLTWAARSISRSSGENLGARTTLIKQNNDRVLLSEAPERLKLQWENNKTNWVDLSRGWSRIWLMTSWAILSYRATVTFGRFFLVRDLLGSFIAKSKSLLAR